MSALSRREFVMVGGATVLPGCDLIAMILPAAPVPLLPAGTSRGPTASAELEFLNGALVPVAWTARGGSRRLEVTAAGVTIDLPTRSPQVLSFAELRMGVGHDTIRRFFGQPTLAALIELASAA